MDDSNRGLAPKKRILLVDDDEQVLFVLRISLQRMRTPCEVVTAQDGRGGVPASASIRLRSAHHRHPAAGDRWHHPHRSCPVTGAAVARDLDVSVWLSWFACGCCPPALLHCLEKAVEVAEFRQIVQQAMAAAPVGDASALAAAVPPLIEHAGIDGGFLSWKRSWVGC